MDGKKLGGGTRGCSLSNVSVPEPGGTAMGAQNKPANVIKFRLRAAPTLQQHKNLIWCKLLRVSYIHKRAKQRPWPRQGRADVKAAS